MTEYGMQGIFLLTMEEGGLDGDDFVDRTHPNDSCVSKYAGAYRKKNMNMKETKDELD